MVPGTATLREPTMPTFKANVFSPRWGHDDVYEFQFEKQTLKISHGLRGSTATYRDNLDPEWTGESLSRILRNDSIAPPEHFQAMIEHLWLEWRDRAMTYEDVDAELQAVVAWLNETTRSKPATDFWKKYF